MRGSFELGKPVVSSGEGEACSAEQTSVLDGVCENAQKQGRAGELGTCTQRCKAVTQAQFQIFSKKLIEKRQILVHLFTRNLEKIRVEPDDLKEI